MDNIYCFAIIKIYGVYLQKYKLYFFATQTYKELKKLISNSPNDIISRNVDKRKDRFLIPMGGGGGGGS